MHVSRAIHHSPLSSRKPAKFEPGVPKYYGPEDGLSRTKRFPRVTGPLLTAGVSLFCRVEKEGAENIPQGGGNVFAPNHVSVLDIPVALNLGVDDMRMMVNIDVFSLPVPGTLLTWGGMYPVNKVKPSPVTKEHTVDIVRSGADLTVFPEGDFTEEGIAGGVGPFKKGVAAAAVLGQAKSVVPVAIHYQANDKSRPLEALGSALLAGGVVTAGVLAPGPVSGTLGGVLTGAYLGGALGRSRVTQEEAWNPGPKFVATAAGAALGAAAGGLAGWAASSRPGLALGFALAGGLATLGLGAAWSNRPVARVKIGRPMEMTSYLQQAQTDRKGAVRRLTQDLHERVGALKADLSGVPYDAAAPKITSARPTIHWKPGTTQEEMRASMSDRRQGLASTMQRGPDDLVTKPE